MCGYDGMEPVLIVSLLETRDKRPVHRSIRGPQRAPNAANTVVAVLNSKPNWIITIPLKTTIIYWRLITHNLHRAEGASIQVLTISGIYSIIENWRLPFEKRDPDAEVACKHSMKTVNGKKNVGKRQKRELEQRSQTTACAMQKGESFKGDRNRHQ